MDPTFGQLHGLYVRALALDNGARPLMLIRLPSVFPTMPMHEAVAQRLQTLTGENWRDSLVISGTHTHSGPGRFLHLPREALLDLGLLGVDSFHQEVFDWYVDSIVTAATDAIADLKPARMGWTVAEAFDTDDGVSSDRWSATPPFDDNRALLLRVDDLEGNPRAVLTSFGMHGTFNTFREYHSADAPGAIERMLERKLATRYDRHVPVMFFSSNGGSMSPRGDRTGHRESHKFDHIGLLFADKVWDELEGITTRAEVSLGGVTMRFPMLNDLLGYQPGEFISSLSPFDDLRYGGLQCTVANAEDDDYATHAPTERVRCFGVHQVLHNIAPSLFLRSQISALNLDGMTIVTMPGEVTMELGWEVLRAMRDAYGVDPLASFVFGYAQDHKFYLTPNNLRGDSPPFPGQSTPMPIDDYPDYAFSYFQGGYEAGFSPWGPRGGDYLRERAVEVVLDPENGIVRLPEALLFDTGEAVLQPRGVRALRELAAVLALTLPCYSRAPASQQIDCPIRPKPLLEAVLVEGHTDDRPISTSTFADNWALASARAINTYKALLGYDRTLGGLLPLRTFRGP